jgi:hypothetical protein
VAVSGLSFVGLGSYFNSIEVCVGSHGTYLEYPPFNLQLPSRDPLTGFKADVTRFSLLPYLTRDSMAKKYPERAGHLRRVN